MSNTTKELDMSITCNLKILHGLSKQSWSSRLIERRSLWILVKDQRLSPMSCTQEWDPCAGAWVSYRGRNGELMRIGWIKLLDLTCSQHYQKRDLLTTALATQKLDGANLPWSWLWLLSSATRSCERWGDWFGRCVVWPSVQSTSCRKMGSLDARAANQPEPCRSRSTWHWARQSKAGTNKGG